MVALVESVGILIDLAELNLIDGAEETNLPERNGLKAVFDDLVSSESAVRWSIHDEIGGRCRETSNCGGNRMQRVPQQQVDTKDSIDVRYIILIFEIFYQVRLCGNGVEPSRQFTRTLQKTSLAMGHCLLIDTISLRHPSKCRAHAKSWPNSSQSSQYGRPSSCSFLTTFA